MDFYIVSVRFLISFNLLTRAVAAEVTQLLRVDPGQNVTLPCRSPNSISAVEWTRQDLEPQEYVALYIDGHSDETYQHLSFKGRAELKDMKMKDGDLSLFLHNVSSNDSGTYECRVSPRRIKRAVIDTDPIEEITLVVERSGPDKDGNHTVGIAVGLFFLFCLLFFVGVFFRKRILK